MEDNWTFEHVAFVVKDEDKAIEYFKSLGFEICVGGSPRPPGAMAVIEGERFEYKGKPLVKPVKYRSAVLNKGSLFIEIFQPVEGKHMFAEFLEKHGEGIQHISFEVDDLEKEKDKMVKKGFPVIFSMKRPDGSWLDCFFDTEKVGNVTVELYQGTSRHAAAIAKGKS